MSRLCFLSLFFLFNCSLSYSQSRSPNSTVSLITCGTGNDLYSTFGHSAIHITDPAQGIDKVYNYGTFDFSTPNFYLKFARGKLDYILSVSNFNRFLRTYQREGRWVIRQELNLSESQKNKLFALLEDNAKPENRAYKYDFFYDNCSTRIRDILEKTLGENLIYSQPETKPDSTFRNYIDLYLTNHPWSDLGIDLALGAPCDRIATARETMFLPDYLKKNLENAQVLKEDEEVPLLKNQVLILAENSNLISRDERSITWIFWVMFIIVAVVSFFSSAQRLIAFDKVFYTVLGILGILIFLLWFATDHSATKWNFNILWAIPSWIAAPFIFGQKYAGTYFKVHAILMFALVVFWMLIPQSLHPATVPIILTAAVRSWSWNKFHFKVKQTSLA